jgi:membrane protease YdiL (CAAX protease family)
VGDATIDRHFRLIEKGAHMSFSSTQETRTYTPMQVGVQDQVAWREVILFCVLAYGMAWAVWAPLAPKMLDAIREGRSPGEFKAGASIVVGMYAPAVAALVMRLFVSREGLRGSLGPRPRLRPVVAAILIPMAFIFAVIGVVIAIRGTHVATPGVSLGKLIPVLLLIGVPVGAVLAFGEEFGWRGYLLRRLLPLGELRAGVLVGVIWSLWHLPILLVGLNYPGQNLIALLAVFMASVVLLSMLHARFFVASGGSVIVTALLHGSLNTFSDRLTDSDHLSGNPLVVGGGGLIAIAIAIPCAVATAVWLQRRRPPARR